MGNAFVGALASGEGESSAEFETVVFGAVRPISLIKRYRKRRRA